MLGIYNDIAITTRRAGRTISTRSAIGMHLIILTLIRRLEITVYHLACRPDEGAVEILEQALKEKMQW